MCDVGRGDELKGVGDFVDQLVVALVNSRIYWPGHPRVRSAIENLQLLLESYCADHATGRLRIGAADGYLIHDRRPLLTATLSGRRIVEFLKDLGSGGIDFVLGMEEEEIAAFLRFMGSGCEGVRGWQEANEELIRRGCRRIRYLPPHGVGKTGGEGEFEQGDEPEAGTPMRLPVKTYQSVVAHLQDLSIKVLKGEDLDLDESRANVESVMKRLDEDPVSMLNLARYEHYDGFTFGHSVRVCFLSLSFAAELTADPGIRESVGLAALLHDVGKAGIPYEILHATRRLSPEERALMERHTTLGAEILLATEKTDPGAVATAFGHHRTADGWGYPQTPVPFPLSAVTKVVKICDVFEALTAVRPYKAAIPPIKAYRIMLAMKGHFDGGLLRAFIESHGVYPVGSTVRLRSGEKAVVLEPTGDLARPKVEIRTTPDGDLLAPEDRVVEDLRGRPESAGRPIVEGPLHGEEALVPAGA